MAGGEFEYPQAGNTGRSLYNYISTITPITPIGATKGNKLLMPEAYSSISANPCFYPYLYFIKHFL